MRKLLLFTLHFYFFGAICLANTVPLETAKKVAVNFYTRQTGKAVKALTLVYTGGRSVPLYYVFDAQTVATSGANGFIIISAEDALPPVIGYSNQGTWVIPQPGTNIYYWMQKEEAEADYARRTNLKASAQVAAQWTSFGTPAPVHNLKRPQTPPQVLPLCQSAWNQSPYYNALCPGGSVTGCVATAMAQIMRYWSYPPHGIDSSFYTETSPENYGLLKANYDTSAYLWNSMPYSINADNFQIANLMYDCGVSVNMSYDPNGSGAWVITADSRICAQASYVNYFGYDANTIQGLKRKNYSDSAWMAMIKNELNNNRLIQYVGWDSVNGGHTWVCDGYDTNSYLHMNWGWGGFDDAYYALDTLNPPPFFFSKSEEMLIGIEPAPIRAAFNATPVNGCTGIQVKFTDRSFVYNNLDSITGWQWSFPGGTPSSSALKNPIVTYNSSGIYPVTLIVTNLNGADTVKKNTYISINGINTLPFVQGFEGGGVFPPPQWTINNPWRHAAKWQLYTGTGGYGNSDHCIYFNNCQDGNPGERDQIYTPAYNFSSITKPYLYFDVAYSPYNEFYSDTLAVYYSLDCGNTFTRIYLKGGMNLCTAGGQTVLGGANQDMNGCFMPLSNNWRTDTVYIPAIAGQSSVMFSFENRSGNGSNLYIDNINVPLALGINQPISYTGEVKLYPNPNNGIFSIESPLQGTNELLQIYNMLGENIYESSLIGNNTYLNLSSQPNGVYLYRVTDENGGVLGEGKFVINR